MLLFADVCVCACAIFFIPSILTPIVTCSVHLHRIKAQRNKQVTSSAELQNYDKIVRSNYRSSRGVVKLSFLFYGDGEKPCPSSLPLDYVLLPPIPPFCLLSAAASATAPSLLGLGGFSFRRCHGTARSYGRLSRPRVLGHEILRTRKNQQIRC